MDIIIGRDEQTRKLKLSVGDKFKLYGSPMSVPKSVSRNSHCCIYVDDNRQMTIANLKPTNITYVNGVGIENKRITVKDNIELGGDHYRLNWFWVNEFLSLLEQSKPTPVSIRHLEKVYEDYHNKSLSLTKSQMRMNVLSRSISIFSIGGAAVGMLTGQHYWWLYAVALLICVVTLVKAWVDSTKVTRERDEMNHQFMLDYTCPKCHRFLGNYAYDIIVNNNPKCPGCSSPFET